MNKLMMWLWLLASGALIRSSLAGGHYADAALTLIIAYVALLLSVGLHELGHFLAAKMVGAAVLEVRIGSGPIICRFKWKETFLFFHAIPDGGVTGIIAGGCNIAECKYKLATMLTQSSSTAQLRESRLC